MPLVFPAGPFFKKGRNTGGKAKKEAKQERSQAPRPNDAQDGPSRHQQTCSGHTQHNGGGKNPTAHFTRLDDHALVDLINIDQVVNLRPADIFAAPAQGKEVDQGKIGHRQPQRGEGEAEIKLVRQTEQGE